MTSGSIEAEGGCHCGAGLLPGDDALSVNWRALDGVDGITAQIRPYDGRGGWEAARAALGNA